MMKFKFIGSKIAIASIGTNAPSRVQDCAPAAVVAIGVDVGAANENVVYSLFKRLCCAIAL